MGLIQRERENRTASEALSLSEALVSIVAAALRELPGGWVREPSRDDLYRIECLSRYVKSLLPHADLPTRPLERSARTGGSTALLH